MTVLNKSQTFRLSFCLLLVFIGGCSTTPQLASWNDVDSRDQLIAFVDDVTDQQSLNFVPQSERIAVFDNDGTLWAEQPLYFQLIFAIDRVKAMAADHPEWKTTQPFQAVLENDMDTLAKGGKKALIELLMTTHAGMTTEEFELIARSWLLEARHPESGQLYTQMVYEPMLEMLTYLRNNGFKTFIVSGGGIEFLRVFAEETYGIPPEQVVGSSIQTTFEMTQNGPVIRRLPEIDFNDDKAGKPIAINKHIGRRPTIAFGNSDGDLQMLQWTTGGEGSRLGVLIHHTDAQREYAYDRDSHIGKLDVALDESEARGWIVVDMMNDWNTIFAHDTE
jgi:phosphoserine phosphatase